MSPRFLHPAPWQMGQQLLDSVSFDLSNHYNQLLPCPVGWDISKRNAHWQVFIYDQEGHTIGLDTAHYENACLVEWPSVLSN